MRTEDIFMFIMVGFVVLLLLLFLVFMPFTFIFGIPINSGSGEHVGYVTAVETTGVIFKTPSAYFKSDAQSSQEDKYCVNPEAVDALKKFAESRERVKIVYDNRFFGWGVKNCPSGVGDKITAVFSVQ